MRVKYVLLVIFSITFAWTSTPGTVTPSGIFTKSNKPWADAPIKTYLFSKKEASKFPSNTFEADIYWFLKGFLYLIHIIAFGSEFILYGLTLISLIPVSSNFTIKFFFLVPALINSNPKVGNNLLSNLTIKGRERIIPSDWSKNDIDPNPFTLFSNLSNDPIE